MTERKTISFVTFIAAEHPLYVVNSLTCLQSALLSNDELIIIIDDEHYENQLDSFSGIENNRQIKILHHKLNNDFAAHRNFAIDNCKCDYIFMLDADEIMSWVWLQKLHYVDDSVRVLAFPRINQVIGLTLEDCVKANFQIDSFGRIDYPDYQCRFFKNDGIRYTGKVHERLTENAQSIMFADIIHIKEADRQRKQNNFYEELKK